MELAQNIVGENNDVMELIFKGKPIKLTNLTPRLFFELGYSVVIIKPSSYLLGVNSSVREIMTNNTRKEIWNEQGNISEENKIGLNPIQYFHPHGPLYSEQNDGISNIIIVEDTPINLSIKKYFIRGNFCQKINDHYVEWFNGKKIKWDTKLFTNLVHSTDDACESSLHALSLHPEYQVMTRFNYPNPKFRGGKNEK